jgi:hypothetical protein
MKNLVLSILTLVFLFLTTGLLFEITFSYLLDGLNVFLKIGIFIVSAVTLFLINYFERKNQ